MTTLRVRNNIVSRAKHLGKVSAIRFSMRFVPSKKDSDSARLQENINDGLWLHSLPVRTRRRVMKCAVDKFGFVPIHFYTRRNVERLAKACHKVREDLQIEGIWEGLEDVDRAWHRLRFSLQVGTPSFCLL